VWSRGAFFLLTPGSTRNNVGDDNGLDEIVIDAYEVAIRNYDVTHSEDAKITEKYRLPIREEGVLAKCRDKVSRLFMFFFFSDEKPYS